MENELQRYDMTQDAMTPDTVVRQVGLIQHVMEKVMRDGEHYGVIPGCGKKPSLLKAGAEKLSLTFRLAPQYEVTEKPMQGNHREYYVKCTLTHIPTDKVFGQGVGACSTMEGKYRFRTGEVEFTGKEVPKEFWKDRDINLIGGKGFSTKKNDKGKWEIVRAGEKVEHDNPADYYNTVLKMAKKRAHVDAVLTATAASDIFTQDVEDMPEVLPPIKEKNNPAPKPNTEHTVVYGLKESEADVPLDLGEEGQTPQKRELKPVASFFKGEAVKCPEALKLQNMNKCDECASKAEHCPAWQKEAL